MSDNFSEEIHISNDLRKYLIESGYTICQLVTPGGQCLWSLLFHDSLDRQRICYPDLICFSEREILLGEMKPKYSKKDRDKLMEIKGSIDGVTNLRDMLSRRYKRNFDSLPVEFVLIHGDAESSPDAELTQIVVVGERVNTLYPRKEG